MGAASSTLVSLAVNTIKLTLIFLSGVTNGVLVWKILNRKNLHTIFNLSICFFLSWSGALFPHLINNYIELLEARMKDPGAACLELCRQNFFIRMMLYQPYKIFILNIMYRSVDL